ncbi:MAG TPA: hypothetical protein PKD55_24295 [Bellilinea sp.]|nr:hypothetical protein [Bellilinea sp.]
MNEIDEREALRQKLIDRYVQALDEGEVDQAIEVLEAALDDPVLTRMIGQVEQGFEEELGIEPLAQQAQAVRSLLQEQLGSLLAEEEEDLSQLTIGEVAARLQADKKVPREDLETNQKLIARQEELPARLSIQAIRELAARLQVKASNKFWDLFRDKAITMQIGRSQAQMAAMRRKAAKRSERQEINDETKHSR